MIDDDGFVCFFNDGKGMLFTLSVNVSNSLLQGFAVSILTSIRKTSINIVEI